jgi:hypothetical protein
MAKKVAPVKESVNSGVRVIAISPGYYKGRIIDSGQSFTYKGLLKKNEKTGKLDKLPLWLRSIESVKAAVEAKQEDDDLELGVSGVDSAVLHDLKVDQEAANDLKLQNERDGKAAAPSMDQLV